MFMIHLSRNIGEIFYSFLWLMMDLITVFLLYYAFLTPRERKINLLIFLATVATAIACNGVRQAPELFTPLWDIPSPLEASLSFAVILFGIRLLFSGRWHRHLIVFIAICAVAVLTQYVLLEKIAARNGCALIPYYWAYDVYQITVTAAKTVTFFLVWLLFGLCKRKSGKHTVISWLLLLIPLPTVVLFLMLSYFRPFDIQYRISGTGLLQAELILAAICTVFVAVANGAVMYLIHVSEHSAKRAAETRLLKQQMDIQVQNYIALEKSYRAQRAASHEFSHHLNTIQTLLETGACDTLSKYVDQLQERQTTKIFSINTHHPIIDAVLNQKYQAAKERGIDMQAAVNDLSSIPIPTDSLVVLLANLLDNAIESCASEKQIRLSFIAEDSVFLCVDNTSAPVTVIDGKISTSKKDPHRHGFGLSNVQMILDDLHAEYTFQYQDGWFRFAAEIPV